MKLKAWMLFTARSMYYAVRAAFLAGNRFACPLCGGRFRRLLPAGVVKRPDAGCPGCSSLERHRLLWLYLQRESDIAVGQKRILHIAPEFCLMRVLKKMPQVDYVTVDRSSDLADYRMDITAMDLASESFDLFLCLHVLEHVADDVQALRELRRILKPGAWGIVGVPIDPAREVTWEDPGVTSPEERLRLFGQADHVRVYGNDCARRFEQVGFEVRKVDYFLHCSPAERERHALIGGEAMFVCRRISS
jgi:SAM-dependent methyltransferase